MACYSDSFTFFLFINKYIPIQNMLSNIYHPIYFLAVFLFSIFLPALSAVLDVLQYKVELSCFGLSFP
jgi:hypothetical protein